MACFTVYRKRIRSSDSRSMSGYWGLSVERRLRKMRRGISLLDNTVNAGNQGFRWMRKFVTRMEMAQVWAHIRLRTRWNRGWWESSSQSLYDQWGLWLCSLRTIVLIDDLLILGIICHHRSATWKSHASVLSHDSRWPASRFICTLK